jgi:phosphatidylcholine synthase
MLRLVAAWAVHAYTASGALLAWLAILATLDGHYRLAFAWLAVQVFVDATDGWFARLARVSERCPSFSGAHLDDIVDYLTYVLVPALIVWHARLVPDAVLVAVPAAMLLSSAYGFSRLDAKTEDHFFTGFPSYWNIVVAYLVAWEASPVVNAIVLAWLALMVFVPVRYIYPSRTVPLMRTTIVLGALWAVLMILMLGALPDVPAWLLVATSVFPVYYVAASLWLEFRRLAAERHAT